MHKFIRQVMFASKIESQIYISNNFMNCRKSKQLFFKEIDENLRLLKASFFWSEHCKSGDRFKGICQRKEIYRVDYFVTLLFSTHKSKGEMINCSNHDYSNHNCSNHDCSNHDCSNHDCSNHDCSNPDYSNHDCSNHDCSNYDCSNHDCSNYDCSKCDSPNELSHSKWINQLFKESQHQAKNEQLLEI